MTPFGITGSFNWSATEEAETVAMETTGGPGRASIVVVGMVTGSPEPHPPSAVTVTSYSVPGVSSEDNGRGKIIYLYIAVYMCVCVCCCVVSMQF